MEKINPMEYPLYAEFGKLPPQNIQYEEAILGHCVLQQDNFFRISDIITSDCFYKDEHKEIFAAISDIYTSGKKADILTLTAELRKREKLEVIGGQHYLSELTERIGTSENIITYSQVIAEKYMLRELIKISDRIQTMAYEDTSDCFDLISNAITDISRVSEFIRLGDTKTAKEIIETIYKKINSPENSSFIQGKFDFINNISGGYDSGNVYIFASRPGHGKSVLAMNEAMFIAKKHPILYHSLEMKDEELIKRGIADYGRISNFRIQKNQIDQTEIESFNIASGRIEKLKLYINDRPKQSVEDIYLNAKKYKIQHGIKLLIIDHFHLLKLTKKTDSESYAYNIQRLKEIAKELEIPIIVLFQLNRDIEKDHKRPPRNSDLREVGEQDADFIMFMRRPELWGETKFMGEQTAGMMLWDVTKNRQGTVKGKIMRFEPEYQSIQNEVEFEECKF